MYKMIVCTDSEGGIGKNNTIPWDCPEDRKLFRDLTLNQNVIMGSRTYQTLIRPLFNRNNIILSRNADIYNSAKSSFFLNENKKENNSTENNRKDLKIVNIKLNITPNDFKLFFFSDISEIIEKYKEGWIIGGAEIYKIFFPHVDKIYLSKLRTSYNCDTFFPEIPDNFQVKEKKIYTDFDLFIYERVA